MEQTALAGVRHVVTGAAMLCLTTLAAQAADVTFNDIADEGLASALRGGSLLQEQTLSDENQPSPSEVLAAAQADYKRLLAVLYDNGYFGGSINITLDGREAASIPPVQPPSAISRAVIRIEPGPKFTFGRARISPLPEGGQAPSEFATDETASLGAMQRSITAGVDGWRAQGHAKAALANQQVSADHPARRVHAELALDPGPLLRFGPLLVEGESDVRRARIIEIAGLPEGEVFSPEEIRLSRERLRRTGAFSVVALHEGEHVLDGDLLPIEAQIGDAPKRRIGFGAELSTLEGLTLSAYWLHRNLLGGAERLRLDAEVSGIGGGTGGTDYLLEARFERPATFNEDTDFYALALFEQLDEVSYFSRQLDLEAGIERIASPERTYTLGLGLRTAKTRDVFGEDTYTLLTLPLSAEFDYRDNPLNAKDGYFIKAEATPFLALSGSDDGIRTFVDARGYKTFGTARPVTLALRGQFGSVYGPALEDAPADYLFYSGGGGTVRGQEYQSLGVAVGSDTAGGRSFVGLSAEVRVDVTETIGVVGFADAGYVGEEEFYDGSGTWHSGAGFGLRYNTAIGPIRLDVAVPTSGPEVEDEFQVYIGIGQSF
ncbi:autotransporter assembly complex protein TamA [Sulfitobacter donghicola]|uniref:Membrane protein n=1 Tax=Sulfitobacter donghicola DSW-25 = KCTC 12864 = JCM 14565 TaxID=1300350 RepID=A0A073IK07_9RHOB|nr:autotransporter assembly complex family protein [Sulfitobacter donghicola]KEJ90064.1 membrane protein [Sulfitobacter donghicola DSW-25 = KCTC 12864 = JCM 14565]